MRVIVVLVFTIGLFFALSKPCYANPISFPFGSDVSISIWIASVIMLIGTALIEAWIVTVIARRRLKQYHELLVAGMLFWPVLFINLATFIVTQALAYGLLEWFHNEKIGYFAEIFPLVAEYFMLRWLLTRLYRKGIFSKPFSYKLIVLMTVVANLVTFAAGFAFVWMWRYL